MVEKPQTVKATAPEKRPHRSGYSPVTWVVGLLNSMAALYNGVKL